MYDWHRLSVEERKKLLNERIKKGYPSHRPPHFYEVSGHYHISAACYKHASFIGRTPERMSSFCDRLLATLTEIGIQVNSWCVLPNHYHLLGDIDNFKTFMVELGRLHGRSSYLWNGEDGCRGRKVWHSAGDRYIRSEAHFWATMNYIHNNPVHHGYVEKWTDWPYSSANFFLTSVGREKAAHLWRTYPPLGYGKGWDAPDL